MLSPTLSTTQFAVLDEMAAMDVGVCIALTVEATVKDA